MKNLSFPLPPPSSHFFSFFFSTLRRKYDDAATIGSRCNIPGTATAAPGYATSWPGTLRAGLSANILLAVSLAAGKPDQLLQSGNCTRHCAHTPTGCSSDATGVFATRATGAARRRVDSTAGH